MPKFLRPPPPPQSTFISRTLARCRGLLWRVYAIRLSAIPSLSEYREAEQDHTYLARRRRQKEWGIRAEHGQCDVAACPLSAVFCLHRCARPHTSCQSSVAFLRSFVYSPTLALHRLLVRSRQSIKSSDKDGCDKWAGERHQHVLCCHNGLWS